MVYDSYRNFMVYDSYILGQNREAITAGTHKRENSLFRSLLQGRCGCRVRMAYNIVVMDS